MVAVMRARGKASVGLLLLLAPLSCSGGGHGGAGAAAAAAVPVPGTSVAMDYVGAAAGGFYRAPFPDESRRGAGGAIDLRDFPGRAMNLLVDTLAAIAGRDADGFGLTSGIFFTLDGPPDVAALPTLTASVQPGAPVFLMGVDSGAPDYLQRYPVSVEFRADGGPFGAPNLLSLVPLQGTPLREDTLYAAAVLRRLGDATGAPLGVSLAMAQLAAGAPPAGMPPAAFADHERAIAALGRAGVAAGDLAGIATFRTGRPTAGFEQFRQAILAQPLPQPVTPLACVETFADYYVLESTLRMPVYQGGSSPFLLTGGGWQVDASGQPALQGTEEANIIVTVPRRPMPPAGFPAVVLVRAGFGAPEGSIVNRVTAPNGAPGSGPALEYAQAGFIGVQVDGPLEGRRNTSGLDEDFLIFNLANPLAMRDNIRQSALELVLLAEVLPALAIDPAQCPGTATPQGGPIVIDPATMALMGHSMGSTMAPLALAAAPRYRAAILSGAGASWIENVLWKEKPLAIRPVAESLLGYAGAGRALERCDPVLSLLQWAGEPADPQVYTRYVVSEPRLGAPRDVLMIQGIVDHFILPSIANAMSLSLGLDLAGPEIDLGMPAQPGFGPPFFDVAGFAQARTLALPASANRAGAGGAPVTAVLVQHPEDGIEDGHEVAFQVAAAKDEWRTFLATLAQGGAPTVP
jgi:hypothetical protein